MAAISEKHVLVVDDDDRLRALLKQYLSENGFFVSTAANTKEADELLDVFAVDMLVLDVMMPKETGLQYAKRLQGRTPAPPVLLLTARGEADDRIEGLETGARDYLPKPFAPRELVLRMENILQQSRPATAVKSGEAVQFGEYRFDIASGRLSHHQEPIYLTSSEIECLRILARERGNPVSRDKIAELAGDLNNERSVDVQINRLRKKIEPQPGKPIYIQTVRHAGYVLHAEAA